MLPICVLPLLLAQGTAAPPFSEVDRSPSGALWSTDGHHLYRLSAGAEDWERLDRTPRLHRLRALGPVKADEEDDTRSKSAEGVLLWSGRTTRLWFDDGRGRRPAPGLNGIWIAGIARREGLWLAYGSTVDDELLAESNWGAIDHSVANGPAFTAVVAASSDGGATWKVLDRSPGGQVEALYLADDGVLSLYIAGGGFRRGRLEQNEEGLALIDMRTLVDPSAPERDCLQRLDWESWVYFPSGAQGWIGGMAFGAGAHTYTYHSDNGGRTWRLVEPPTLQSPPHVPLTWNKGRELMSQPTSPDVLSNGLRVKTTRLNHLWVGTEGGPFESLRSFPAQIDWARADGAGDLLVRLRGGGLFLYSCGSDSWSELGAIEDGR